MTLTEFLLAHIAEDEWLAGTASGIPSGGPTTNGICNFGDQRLEITKARVLAECEAKRLAIEEAWSDHEWIMDACGKSTTRSQSDAEGRVPGVVRALAAVYADHPDYLDEWKP